MRRTYPDEKYSDDFRKSVLGLFNVIERTTEDAEDCALVQSQLPTINSHRVEAYRLRDAENQRIREEQQKLAMRKSLRHQKSRKLILQTKEMETKQERFLQQYLREIPK